MSKSISEFIKGLGIFVAYIGAIVFVWMEETIPLGIKIVITGGITYGVVILWEEIKKWNC